MLKTMSAVWTVMVLAVALLAAPVTAAEKVKSKSEPSSPPVKTNSAKEADDKARAAAVRERVRQGIKQGKIKPLLQATQKVGPGRQSPGTTGPGRDTTGAKEDQKAGAGTPKPPKSSISTGPARDTAPATKTGTKEFSGKPVGPARGSDQGDTVKTGASRRDPEPAKLPAATDDPDDKPAKRKPTQDAVDPSKAAARTAKPDDTPAPKQARDSEPKAAASPAPATTRTLAAPAGAAAVAATGTLAANAPAYSHNNSTMKLVPEGDTVRLVYDKPKPGLEGLGIKAGTPLFEGKRTGDSTYAGNATTFSRACGTATFPVAGEASGGTVTLRGQKPVRDSDCKVTGYTSETLVFEAK